MPAQPQVTLIVGEGGEVSILWDGRGAYTTVHRDGTVTQVFSEPSGRTVYTGGRFVSYPPYTTPKPRPVRDVELPAVADPDGGL